MASSETTPRKGVSSFHLLLSPHPLSPYPWLTASLGGWDPWVLLSARPSVPPLWGPFWAFHVLMPWNSSPAVTRSLWLLLALCPHASEGPGHNRDGCLSPWHHPPGLSFHLRPFNHPPLPFNICHLKLSRYSLCPSAWLLGIRFMVTELIFITEYLKKKWKF